MNNSNTKNDIVNLNENVDLIIGILFLLPVLTPIISLAIDKITNFTHDIMEHGYEINVKTGAVNISLTKSQS